MRKITSYFISITFSTLCYANEQSIEAVKDISESSLATNTQDYININVFNQNPYFGLPSGGGTREMMESDYFLMVHGMFLVQLVMQIKIAIITMDTQSIFTVKQVKLEDSQLVVCSLLPTHFLAINGIQLIQSIRIRHYRYENK